MFWFCSLSFILTFDKMIEKSFQGGCAMSNQDKEMAIDCCLLAGRLMMEAGAETYRVEDTMVRMAETQQLTSTQSFVTPTGIIFTPGKQYHTKLIRIQERSTDLEQVALVNDVSRKLSSGAYSLEEDLPNCRRLRKRMSCFHCGFKSFRLQL